MRRWVPSRFRSVGGVLVCASFVVFLVAAAVAAGEERGMTARDVARLQMVTAVAVSPDGRHVAYGRAVPRDPFTHENGPAWVELHVTDLQGHSRPFVAGKVSVGELQWTPDGKQLAFIAQRGDDKHPSLYVLPVDGGEARRLLAHDAAVRGVAWSPDGQYVAFLASEPLTKEQQDYQAKGFDAEIYEEDWRPTKVWIAAADGTVGPRALELPGSAAAVQWRPGHRQLAVVLTPTPLVDDDYMFKRIHVVDIDTGHLLQKIDNPGKLGAIAWSPDGGHLAMISGADAHDPQEGRLLLAAVPGDGTLRDLMPDLAAHVSAVQWQDASTVMWLADEGTLSTLGTVDLAGNRHVVRGPSQPVLSALSLSRDGQVAAVIGETPAHPREVFLLAGSAAPTRLTHSNPWLAELRLARQEVVRWTARDGLALEGILVYPLNHEPGRRYPLIMTVHGGPEAHVPDGWVTSYSNPGQLAAARGFAVFYPNYRGSTGRGVEFSKLGHADAAGKEFDDLVDGIDHLVALGLVAPDKVGITGGSYGGYASAWGATYYSHRFAASVMFVGISDNVSKVGTTDIPEEMYLVHHRKRLWDDWQYFLERSPIRHVQKHRTPILILHGKSDPRVHPSQSLELFRHLKTLQQAPARLVLYPGEGHGNRRAAARFDYQVRLLQWMEHYLQGPGGAPPPHALDYDAFWAR